MSDENIVAVNSVTFEDGSTRDFGKKGQIQREITNSSNGDLLVKLFLVSGKAIEFAFPVTNELYPTMVGKGIMEYLGNAVAGVYSDKDGLHPEDFNLGIERAVSNLVAGVIPARTRVETESTKGMSDLIRAYAELRAEAVDADGEPRFSVEEASPEAVKALILGSDVETNKARLAQVTVKAKIEGYKLERQVAKAAVAQSKVKEEADLL